MTAHDIAKNSSLAKPYCIFLKQKARAWYNFDTDPSVTGHFGQDPFLPYFLAKTSRISWTFRTANKYGLFGQNISGVIYQLIQVISSLRCFLLLLRALYSPGRRCPDVFGKLMPVLCHSIQHINILFRCVPNVYNICKLFIVLVFLCFISGYHYSSVSGFEIRGSNGSKCYLVFSFIATRMLM